MNPHTPRPSLVPTLLATVGIFGASCTPALAGQPDPGAGEPSYLDALRTEAAALGPTVETDAVRQWLDATALLTPITARSIYVRPEPRAILGPSEFEALPEGDRAGFTPREITESAYYTTGYGTPLCYARALDVASRAARIDSFAARRVLDYGYGQMGQMRLLAACGAHVVGVDPSASLGARYSLPEDQGPYPPTAPPDARGSVTIVTGLWPGEPETAAAVGAGFDLIVARNVLKHGYVHPIAEVAPASQINLSCTDEEYLRAVHDALTPGGLFLIYNLGGPRLRAGAYDPSADINCPWTAATLEAAGFEVLAFDADDSAPTREQVLIFGWAEEGDPIDSDWFSLYTLVRRPVR